MRKIVVNKTHTGILLNKFALLELKSYGYHSKALRDAIKYFNDEIGCADLKIGRDSKHLIKLVENVDQRKMKLKDPFRDTKLVIVEIPMDVKWGIAMPDWEGEHVFEQHRTWYP